MLLGTIRFEPFECKPGRRVQLEEGLGLYLSLLSRTGQAVSDPLVAWKADVLTGHIELARPDAIERSYHSAWALRELDAIVRELGDPRWEVAAAQAQSVGQEVKWQDAEFLWIFTGSRRPIRAGTDGESIPAYLVPADDQWREDLWSWSLEAALLDDLYLASGALEVESYTVLATMHSDLSVAGRGFAKELEGAAGKPAYYYLPKYYGRLAASSLPCPSCGLECEPSGAADYVSLWCKPCRLITGPGDDQSNPDWAQIGEWQSGP